MIFDELKLTAHKININDIITNSANNTFPASLIETAIFNIKNFDLRIPVIIDKSTNYIILIH